ncbi:hypothetical protein T484DRAFT_1769051 [Baffinella frigidus]|nr:hypothetical protein T484DRAFT_1769051 [Cryptophyta sp. CCMP2293]
MDAVGDSHAASGLFKMDAVGDSYVAAGWLPGLEPSHAAERCLAMVRVAQRMLRVLAQHRSESGWNVRTTLHP